MREVSVAAAYAALNSDSLHGTVDISCPPTNAAVVYFLGDDGNDVPWQPGEWHTFKNVDLSEIQMKGTVGDTITIVGYAGGFEQ